MDPKPQAPSLRHETAAKSGTVGAIRDKMQFSDEWATIDHAGPCITLRLYWTKGGTYGPQCRAVLWVHGEHGPWASDRTTGCGYSKPNAAVADVIARAVGGPSHEGAEPGDQLARAFPGRSWHHAHG
jgi:hypothetical protein